MSQQPITTAPRRVRPPFSTEFIDCHCEPHCNAVSKDDCGCIAAWLAARDGATSVTAIAPQPAA